MEGFFIIAVIAVAVFVFTVRQSKAVNEAWTEAASKLRLDSETNFSHRTMHGMRTDLALSVTTEKVGKATYTKYVSEFSETLPVSIRLKPQGFFSNVRGAFLDRIDIETGDSAFDAKVVIESDSAEMARGFLKEEVRDAVMNLISRFDEFELTEHRITVKQRRVLTNAREMVEAVRLLEISTRRIREATIPTGEPAKVPPPLPSRKKKEQENEVLQEEKNLAAQESKVPIPEESLQSEIVPDPPAEKEQEADPVASVFELDPDNDSIFALHCRELFSECGSRYERTRVFDAELKETELDESLVLLQAEPFSMDRHLGRGPGVRLTFPLGRLPGGEKLFLAGNTNGEKPLAEWRKEEGERVPVSGKIRGFDAFSNTLFIQVPEAPEEKES